MKRTIPDKGFLLQLGERLKQLRLAAGYTSQESFAYECKIPRVQYSRYEKGANITMSTLLKIAKFHNKTLAEIFEGM